MESKVVTNQQQQEKGLQGTINCEVTRTIKEHVDGRTPTPYLHVML